jgi:serine/threonine protein kinase
LSIAEKAYLNSELATTFNSATHLIRSVPSDVFSLGLIYFQMLFGRLPYEDGIHPAVQLASQDYYKTTEQILTANIYSTRLNDILLRMLHPVASARYSKYDELGSDLKKVLQSTRPLVERILG